MSVVDMLTGILFDSGPISGIKFLNDDDSISEYGQTKNPIPANAKIHIAGIFNDCVRLFLLFKKDDEYRQ
jgi:hypothetical protein